MGAALSFSRDEVSRLEAELRAAHAATAAAAEQAVQVPVLEEHVATLEASLAAEQALRQRSAQTNRDEIIKVRNSPLLLGGMGGLGAAVGAGPGS